MNTLTTKHQKFADEYLISGNATDAALKAGYSPKTAYSQGQRLLKHVEVKAYIAEQLDKLHSAKTADAQEVIETLTAIMRGEVTEEVPLLCGEGCQELADKNTAVKDRLKAAELLGKRYRLFDDDGCGAAANAIADFVKALHTPPDEVAALYAGERDDGLEE